MQRNSHPSTGCYSNQNGQKRTKLDRNEKKQFPRLQKQLNTAVQHKPILFLSTQLNKQSVSNKSKIEEKISIGISKKKQTQGTRCQETDWWLDSPQEWQNDEREESLLDPKWNRSMSNTNELSEQGEITETVQRSRKIIRGGRKNRDSSDSETRQASRVKWQLEPKQQ